MVSEPAIVVTCVAVIGDTALIDPCQNGLIVIKTWIKRFMGRVREMVLASLALQIVHPTMHSVKETSLA